MAAIQAIEARSSGQVIVDLCSVAKELVENSLDAGATSIALKHYTSKLSSFSDLTSLQTFGFRGEALSSLCALADFHIVTAQANQVPRANRLDFESSGKLQKTQIVAGQKGTSASVEGIFKRLPVRRRELEKNIKREYGKVLNLLHAYACISTGVRFSVRNTVGKTRNVVVFTTNGNPTTRENIANVYGAKTLSALIPLDLELEFEPAGATRRAGSDRVNQILVRGHISRPVFGEGRQTPDRQMFFVNSRPCGLPQIAKAFNEVYKSFNVSQSPFIFADFQMDTNAYDVNVSPDKRTILLHDAGAMIESLKTSLAQLFEAADQTVPQSLVLGSKQTPAKQQPLASLPGFASARQINATASKTSEKPGHDQDENGLIDEESESGRQEAGREIQRFMSSQDTNASKERAPLSSSPAASSTRPVEQASFTRQQQEPDSPSVETEDNSGSQIVDDTADNSQEASSQPSEVVHRPALQQDEPDETPNAIQTAFDRMRPLRRPAEMATITIGGTHTVKSMIGSASLRKRTSDTASSANTSANREPKPRKRRIFTPSRPSSFGQSMKAFAAPGTQGQEEDEEDVEEEEEEEEEENDESEELSAEDEAQEDIEENEEDFEVASEDGDYAPEDTQHADSLDPAEINNSAPEQESTTGADEDLDEATKKAQEEAVVRRLIHEAEETAVLPQEHNTSRANKMNKGALHRDATVNLASTINGSISQVQDHMTKLRQGLQPHTPVSKPDEPEVSREDSSAEDRLSLTVTKADFAQMRIIGQFNLGFILAVRPGTDHDELFIIDQHASDEKFNFERLQAETVVQNQRLVRPQRLDLTAVEEEIVLANREALEKNGFVVTVDESGDEPIGRRCQLVSLPLSKEVVFGARDLEELIFLLSEWAGLSSASTHSVPRPSKVRKMFAMRACRSSIMVGKTLTSRQMERVVRNMGKIDKPWNCPHGRPTMRHLMSLGQWEAWEEGASNDLDVWKQYLKT
ncbi:hypothetical protein N7474_003432 [Penicillium riverlandense]|uniref:uncharacterized protein n=1 Tax=Penicillium riverlandense TaxID=1903569 RepID=UPI0025483AE6|nr:uncharacterized protein N7474_003432 [Penicillium riverlandense]KAJ5826294.1 hypothetical protein N7474_003432 [Penicillium riverlandense]